MALTFKDIKGEFVELVQNDKTAQKYLKKAAEGSATYNDASLYAVRIGDLLGKVLKRHEPVIDISEWDLENLIPQSLGLNHDMVANVCEQVQTSMNEKAGLGIRAIRPKFDGNRAYGIVEELRNNPEFVNIEKTFYDQVTNFTQNVVDEAVRNNAELQSNAGIQSYVIRTAEADACPWCVALAGTYDYDEIKDAGNDVWRRHDNCRCVVEFVNEFGKDLVSSKDYHYRGSGGTPRSRSSAMRQRNHTLEEQKYHEFKVKQVNAIKESKGWSYDRALAYYNKNEKFYKDEIYGGR